MAGIMEARSKRRIGFALVGALLVLLPLLLLAAAIAPTPTLPAPAVAGASRSPCRWPQRLLAAGLLKEAALADHLVARRVHDPAALHGCVADGLTHVREVRDQRAATLDTMGQRVGLSATTIERLEVAVRIERSATVLPRVVAGGIVLEHGSYGVAIATALHRARYEPEASSVLRATLRRFPSVHVPVELRGLAGGGLDVVAAQALSRAGFDDAALDELRKALAADPTVAVPAELSQPDHRLDWWNTLRGWVGPWIRTLAEILLAALIAVVTGVLLAQLWRRGKERLSIEAFKASADGLGSTTAASVRESYAHVRDDDGTGRVRIVDKSALGLDLPQGVTDVVPQASFLDAVLALLDRLFPSRLWSVNGELLPWHPVRGVGMRLTLTRRKHNVFVEQTFWEQDYGPWPRLTSGADPTQENYDRLAVPAAAWLAFETVTAPTPSRSWARRISASRREFVVLGTRDWRSYAVFAVGADIHVQGDLAGARLRYQRALGLDAGNYGAAMNLAIAELQAPMPASPVYASPRRRLDELCDAMVEDEDGDARPLIAPNTPMWFRVRCNCALAHLWPGDDPDPARARERAAQVCAAIEDALALGAACDRSLDVFVRRLQPLALLLLASAHCMEGAARTLPDPLPTMEHADLLEHVHAAQSAPDSTATTYAALAGYVQETFSPLRPDVRYSLACFFIRARAMSRAEIELHTALEQGDAALRKAVIYDVVLRPYCRTKLRRIRLTELLERLGTVGAES